MEQGEEVEEAYGVNATFLVFREGRDRGVCGGGWGVGSWAGVGLEDIGVGIGIGDGDVRLRLRLLGLCKWKGKKGMGKKSVGAEGGGGALVPFLSFSFFFPFFWAKIS